jgi:excisionase family DNA binding protein
MLHRVTGNMNSEKDELMTVQEVIDYLKISRQTLFRLRKNGVIQTYKVGERGLRFKRSEIESYVKKEHKE